ncbi:site-specific integrase [Paraburkholderia unamae]|uniref:Site-specific integrase n=1 Tax=Paraburkholderia unamae TaxID=219649 RepID=A0ACC6RH24_9BURK
MGSILTRNGRHTALIRLKKHGHIVHSESKTFGSKREAEKWMKHREVELEKQQVRSLDPILSDVIDRYINENEKIIGRTKAQCLRTIKKADIGKLPVSKIDSVAVSAWLKGMNVQPSTRGNYLSHLRAVAGVARDLWDYPLDPDQLRKAAVAGNKMGTVKKSNTRTRRPSVEEMNRIVDYFRDRDRRGEGFIPMTDIIEFALFSCRRQDEITRIEWVDVQKERVLVRDMKHPGQKIGNDTSCRIPPEAARVIDRQPRVSDRVFPFVTKSVSSAFTKACAFLEIDNLHFHDLRHEGTSRLFEMGWTIPQVAEVTGHRSWASLKRYAHLEHSGDKWAGWTTVLPPVASS